MITGLNVLVVEDEPMIASDIADAVAAAGGCVIGPVPRVDEALALLQEETIHAAVLDANLLDRNITPVISVLLARKTALVVYTGAGLPAELHGLKDVVRVVLKPASSGHVIDVLGEVIKSLEP